MHGVAGWGAGRGGWQVQEWSPAHLGLQGHQVIRPLGIYLGQSITRCPYTPAPLPNLQQEGQGQTPAAEPSQRTPFSFSVPPAPSTDSC